MSCGSANRLSWVCAAVSSRIIALGLAQSGLECSPVAGEVSGVQWLSLCQLFNQRPRCLQQIDAAISTVVLLTRLNLPYLGGSHGACDPLRRGVV